MSTSLSDLFTTAKNIVTSISDLLTGYLNVNGQTSTCGITAATVVKNKGGRVVRISVTVAGSTAGSVNNANSISSATAANALWVIPNTVGVYDVSLPAPNGIIVTPGTGQTVAISWA